MRIAIRSVQIFVGVLFIISGLVKANDPVGLSYKMQEFFELWSEGWTRGSLVFNVLEWMHAGSLALSVAMITLEVLAGIALLLGWMKQLVLWLLLLLIVFFTFLTGYAYLSGRFTNCGCFGDCLPISPLTSFIKDIVLLVMVVFLLIGQKHITPLFTAKARTVALLGTLIATLGLQWYVLNFLPIADCLPFKEANHIPQQMKPPPGAVTDSFAIRFIYEKGGKRYEFAPENLPNDFTTYTFIDRKQTLVRKGNADPAIKGFSLTGVERNPETGNLIDSVGIVLEQPKALLVFTVDFKDVSWIPRIKGLTGVARQKNIPLYVVSPNRQEGIRAFRNAGVGEVHFFNTDFTIARTVARTNPTILLLQSGVVKEKWSKREIDKAAGFILSQP